MGEYAADLQRGGLPEWEAGRVASAMLAGRHRRRRAIQRHAGCSGSAGIGAARVQAV